MLYFGIAKQKMPTPFHALFSLLLCVCTSAPRKDAQHICKCVCMRMGVRACTCVYAAFQRNTQRCQLPLYVCVCVCVCVRVCVECACGIQTSRSKVSTVFVCVCARARVRACNIRESQPAPLCVFVCVCVSVCVSVCVRACVQQSRMTQKGADCLFV